MKASIVILSDRSLAAPHGRMRRSAILYSEIARSVSVLAFTRVGATEARTTVEISPGLIEERIPRTAAEAHWQSIARRRWGDEGGDDSLWFDRIATLNPPLVSALQSALSDASLCICVRPYAYKPLRALTDLPIVYDALELEYPARAAMSPRPPNYVELLEAVADLEASCVRGAASVITGDRSSEQLGPSLYDVEAMRFSTLRLIADRDVYAILTNEQRQARKATTNLNGQTIALLATSGSASANYAFRPLIRLAAEMPAVYFLLVGQLPESQAPIPRPPNLHLTGPVDETTLAMLFDFTDVFVDAAGETRGDVGLRVLDAAAHGAPLVLTPDAAACIFRDGIDADVAPLGMLPSRIRALLDDPARRERQSSAARETAEAVYSSRAGASPVLAMFDALLTVSNNA